MSKLKIGQDYSDRRHAARLTIRRAFTDVMTKLAPEIPRKLALEILVESAVGFRAWDQDSSDETSLQVGRLARRVRNKEPIEM